MQRGHLESEVTKHSVMKEANNSNQHNGLQVKEKFRGEMEETRKSLTKSLTNKILLKTSARF